MANYTLVVLTNPAEGRADEYNEWYTDTHIRDVLRVPGFVAAERFKLAPAQRSADPSPFGYAALYDIETDDLKACLAELGRRAGTEEMLLSTAMDTKRLVIAFETMGPKQYRESDT